MDFSDFSRLRRPRRQQIAAGTERAEAARVVEAAWRGAGDPAIQTMTTAEYFKTPETMLPRELTYGELRVADAPRVAHQRIVGKLYLALTRFVEEGQFGEVLLSPTDVILDYDAALVVQPDLLVVSTEHAPRVTDRVYGAPDLVVEVLSPHPRIGKLEERVGWFARYGVRECWLVSLHERRVVVLTFEAGVLGDRRSYAPGDAILSSVIPDFVIPPGLFPGYA